MEFALHPDIHIQKYSFGAEKAPLLIIDNLVSNPETLVQYAAQQNFVANSDFYPGIRALTPLYYQQGLLDGLQDIFIDYFNLPCLSLKFKICQYSIVTTPAQRLKLLQRIPHFDSMEKEGLASVHYLFKGDKGGTSFYRHKKTGFEFIDHERKIDYFRSLEAENDGQDMPKGGYINGNTALFEKIYHCDAIYNRMIIYRRNSLHSGAISPDFIPDANPLTGRLSINSFIDIYK